MRMYKIQQWLKIQKYSEETEILHFVRQWELRFVAMRDKQSVFTVLTIVIMIEKRL